MKHLSASSGVSHAIINVEIIIIRRKDEEQLYATILCGYEFVRNYIVLLHVPITSTSEHLLFSNILSEAVYSVLREDKNPPGSF